MNVLLQNRLYLLLLLAWAPFALGAQIVNLTTYQNIPIQYGFVSSPNAPHVVIEPQRGTRQLVQSPAFNYTLTYTPQEDYIGTDLIRISYWTPNPPASSTYGFLEFHISVLPANVTANPDFATTTVGVPVNIDVLANDFSSNGTFNLTEIPLANNGLASRNGASVTFVPAADFVGLAHFNYIVCDGAGTCDNGTVSISVIGPGLPDTLKVFTTKNKAQSILVPTSYALTTGPQQGTYTVVDGIPTYTPAQNYIGLDYLNYDYAGQPKTVQVNVLNLSDNTFAFDDVANTTSYNTIEFNVLENDLYGTGAGCVSVGTPQFGSLQHTGNGNVIYSPPPGFTGVDVFTYSSRPISCNGSAEIATVRVFVSNFEPARTRFEMSTPKRTPLIIGYSVPISEFLFQITDQGDLGEAVFLEGQVDTVIYGQQISGYNLILYIPYEDVEEGLDEFEVRYCVTNADGDCTYQKSVKVEMDILNIGAGDGPMCFGDCVWPGDTNFDGVVNMEDILPLGLSMGEVGKPRANATLTTWYGQYADNWVNIFDPTAIDLKHLDTDGDSLVTALDTTAISMYYSRTHSLTPARVPYYENEIILQGNIFASPGDLIELDMVLGNSGNPAHNVYGFTFPFVYNPLIFVPESVGIEFRSNSWLTYNSPVLHMTRNNQAGLLEAGYTRTSGLSASGHGEIGKLRLIVSDDIQGFREDGNGITVNFTGGLATGMSGSGQTYGIPVRDFTLHIVPRPKEETPVAITADQVKVYPNPASNFLNVYLNGGYEMEELTLSNITGQQLFHANLSGKRTMIDVNALENGLYFLTIRSNNGIVTKKIEVLR
ncbi:MAG: Ig-like domain-containing protein [Saprospiraceae bacterium]|nr:Ig-like domain-containing protein [Saprospiraceae bacterium]MDZ4706706.1 Ig-like domain-containing protein [Saprospiraceae bacterium]